ncbi:response regulator [Marinomonas fungiae]|uniref:Response regulator receiver domain n=1 Tax=Marinomonas fungiae TaxID=1137284 RepID=A0A0K6IPF5_9GAMM|nr:response regulator [Marinomonas fungiae]CUB05172.1 Response regulator receiver domain [Marinomonas fungiae]
MKDLTFLVVDDSQTVRSLVKTAIFTQFGSNRIFTASNGVQAKDILLSKEVDVIISDWEMPKMSGQELLAFVKKSKKLSKIPFIMMTTRGGKESVLEAIQNGVSHYVVKPFTTEKLEDAIRRSWTSSRKRKEMRYAGLPQHILKIATPEQMLDGRIQNISRSGALLDLPFHSALALFSNIRMHISIPLNDNDTIQLFNLAGRIIRISAHDASDPNNKNCSIALIFDYEKCEQKTKDSLNYLIDFLSSNLPKLVKEATLKSSMCDNFTGIS